MGGGGDSVELGRFFGRALFISQSKSIYSGTTIKAGAKSDHINLSVNMSQAGIELR